MSIADSATSIYAESVDRLRTGDRVSPVERLRGETFALLDQIPAARNNVEVGSALPALRSALERPLAVALALLDYGGERGPLEVAWMAQTLATDLGEKEAEPTEPMLALALHDLAFSLLADCLARDRLEPLPSFGAVSVPGRFEPQASPIFQAPALRYLNAFQRGADRAYIGWSEWLAASELTAALSHVRAPDSYRAATAEAELIAALAFAQRHGGRVFCGAIGDGGAAERRLRLRVRDPESARALAAFLALEAGPNLGEGLNQLYQDLAGPDGFGTSTQLITLDREAT